MGYYSFLKHSYLVLQNPSPPRSFFPQIKKVDNILKINWLTKMSSAWVTETMIYVPPYTYNCNWQKLQSSINLSTNLTSNLNLKKNPMTSLRPQCDFSFFNFYLSSHTLIETGFWNSPPPTQILSRSFSK